MEDEINGINHMDLANQIDNPWERDTILVLINKSKNINYSIRLRNTEKSKLKKKYINLNKTHSAKRHNKKIINLIFAYMIFKILQIKKDVINSVLICPDHRPSKEVHHYIQKLSYSFGMPKLTEEINIKFFNRKKYDIKKRTNAHNLARKILKGKKKANMKVDFEELDKSLSKLL
jgi:hypothetical protein